MAQSVGDLVVNIGADAAKFKEQVAYARTQLKGLGTDADSANKDVAAAFAKQELAAKRAGISVGQYRAAMRTLPAQFTDIATQLAGGQSPWLILLQQGGQIKDTFGGLRPTFTSLVGALNPVTVGVAGLAAAVGAVAYSFYTGQSILSDYNKSLVMTGDRAGQTANNLLFMNESMEKAGGSFSSGTAAISALVKAGANLGKNYQGVASSIATLSKVTSTSVDDLAAVFGKITNDPESGLRAMAEQYGHVSAAQLDYVSALQDAGKYTDALNYANGVAAAGFKDMAANVQENMGYLETAAKSVGNAFSWMWNQLLDLGRQESLQQQLADATDRLYELDKALKQSGAQGQQRMGMERARDLAHQEVNTLTEQVHAEQRKTEEQQRQANLQASTLKNQQHFQSITDAGLTKEQQRTQEYQRLNAYIADRKKLNQALSDEEIAQIKKGIEERYKEPKAPKPKATTVSSGDKSVDSTNAATLALQTQLKVLQQHSGLTDTISQQRKQLWETQAKFSVLEDAAQTRALSKEEKSLLANKDKVLAQAEINAQLGDQIAAQERLNKLRDSSQKYVTQISEKTAAMNAGAGLGSRQSQRMTEAAQLRQGWLNQGGSLSDNGFQSELNALKEYYEAQDKLREDWLSGSQSALADYADQATNYSQMVADTTTTILQGVTTSISEGLQGIITGTESVGDAFENVFTGLGKMVIQTLTQMAAQWLVYQAVSLLVGKTTQAEAGTAMFANAQAAAKMAELNAYSSTAAIPIVGPAMAPVAAGTAAAFAEPLAAAIGILSLAGMAHSGIDSVPETGTWLLQRGERVVTSNTSAKLDATLAQIQQQKDQDRAAMASGFSYSPTIQVNGDPDARTLNMLESAVKRGAQQGYDMVTNHLASGQGRVSKAVGGKWATKRKIG